MNKKQWFCENSEVGRATALRIPKKQWNNINDRSIPKDVPFDNKNKNGLKFTSAVLPQQEYWKEVKTREEKLKKYYQIRKDQIPLRNQYVEESKKRLPVKDIHRNRVDRGLRMSEVLYEREKQIEFNKQIKKDEIANKSKDMEIIKRAHGNDIKSQQEEEENELRKRKEFRETCIEQFKTKEKGTEISKKHKKEDEEIYAKVSQEIKEIERQKLKENRKEKRKRLGELQKELEKEQTKQINVKKNEEIFDKLNAIYQEAKMKLNDLIKAREIELQKALEKRQNIAANIVATENNIEEQEQERIMRNAITEKDKMAEELTKEKLELRKKLRDEILEQLEEVKRLRKERIRRETETQRYEIMNKIQKEKYQKEYELRKKIKHWQEVLERRKALLKQMEEKELAIKEAKKEDNRRVEEYLVKLAEEEKEFFEYGEEVLQLAKDTGRPTFPIEKAIEKHKEDNKLLLKQLQEKYKINKELE